MAGEGAAWWSNVPWPGLGAVTVVAAVIGIAATQGLGVMLAVPAEDRVATDAALVDASADAEVDPTRQPRRTGLPETTYVNGVLARNIFDKSKIGVEASEDVAAGEDGETTLDVRLIGTIVAEPATFSAAFIEPSGKKGAYAYGIGQKIEDAEIIEILDDAVKLRRGNGREEWLRFGDDKTSTDGAASADAEPASDGGDITQTGENTFVIDRGFVEEQLSDLAGLARSGRALLHRGPDGDYDGYRLSAIRRGSLPDKLGIRNGDIIHNVNGLEMNSMDGAMRALTDLRGESSLKVEVTRRGQPVTLSYDIR